MTAWQYAEYMSDTKRPWNCDGAPRGGKTEFISSILHESRDSVDFEGRCGDAQCTMRTSCTSFWWDKRGAQHRKGLQSRRRITAGATKRIIDASVLMASSVVYYERFSRCDANAEVDAAWESFKNLWAVNRASNTIEASLVMIEKLQRQRVEKERQNTLPGFLSLFHALCFSGLLFARSAYRAVIEMCYNLGDFLTFNARRKK